MRRLLNKVVWMWWIPYLDAESECMTNPAGNDYHGTMATAASGRACMKWIDVHNYTISASLTIINISVAESYCRRVPFTSWNGPSCITRDHLGIVRLEQCNVSYCGKPISVFFTEKPVHN